MEAVSERLLSSIVMVSMLVIGCTGVRPVNLGTKEGKLALCPSSPNCVSSQSSDHEHAVEPLLFSGTTAGAHEALRNILLSMKRSRIITDTDSYVHAEFTSAIFRFVDDVEFLLDESTKVIHVRSASRLGKSDLGVNRKRVEDIRARWKAAGK
ncbi:MAG: DUF1499 domain-containing protein [Nitrospirae bacterium]|nr:DUF1499 domain-containing protein [Nitrospirota bacterium]